MSIKKLEQAINFKEEEMIQQAVEDISIQELLEYGAMNYTNDNDQIQTALKHIKERIRDDIDLESYYLNEKHKEFILYLIREIRNESVCRHISKEFISNPENAVLIVNEYFALGDTSVLEYIPEGLFSNEDFLYGIITNIDLSLIENLKEYINFFSTEFLNTVSKTERYDVLEEVYKSSEKYIENGCYIMLRDFENEDEHIITPNSDYDTFSKFLFTNYSDIMESLDLLSEEGSYDSNRLCLLSDLLTSVYQEMQNTSIDIDMYKIPEVINIILKDENTKKAFYGNYVFSNANKLNSESQFVIFDNFFTKYRDFSEISKRMEPLKDDDPYSPIVNAFEAAKSVQQMTLSYLISEEFPNVDMQMLQSLIIIIMENSNIDDQNKQQILSEVYEDEKNFDELPEEEKDKYMSIMNRAIEVVNQYLKGEIDIEKLDTVREKNGLPKRITITQPDKEITPSEIESLTTEVRIEDFNRIASFLNRGDRENQYFN